MLPKLLVVFSMVSLILFLVGCLVNINKVEDNRCKMTYMYEYPQFLKISFPENDNFVNYGLHAYSEGFLTEKTRKMQFNGAPVIFIPGNAGSYKQARSLASVALRKRIDKRLQQYLDYFTVDLNEEFSGLYGGVLTHQVEFVQLCIQQVLKLYQNKLNGPKSVILIGHSLGGKIAQAAAISDTIAPLINSIIAIASPLDSPVISLDHYYQHFYQLTNEQWKANRTVCSTLNRSPDTLTYGAHCCSCLLKEQTKTLDHILLVTIGGGIRDTLVHDGLTTSMFSDIHAMAYNIPSVWLSVDHQCAVWCLQLVLVVNRFLLSMLKDDLLVAYNFIMNKNKRYQVALDHFKNSDASRNLPNINTFNEVDSEDWIEDIRRNIHYSFETGLVRPRIQMISLKSALQYQYMKTEVTNLGLNSWIFGCSADVIQFNMRFCSQATSLNNYSKVLPYFENDRRVALINLHDTKRQNPKWTHILLKLPKTDKFFEFSVDITSQSERKLNIYMPKWYSFGYFTALEKTAENSSFYNIDAHGLHYSYQSLVINIEVLSCGSEDSSVVLQSNVPWANDFDRYSYFRHKIQNTFYVFVPFNKPNNFNSTNNPVNVILHLNPKCTYSIRYAQSFCVTIARIVQQFIGSIPAHSVTILLLVLRHQISTSSKDGFKWENLPKALINSTPIFIVTASRVFAKFLTLFKVLPSPEYYDIPIIVPIVLHGTALAVLMLLASAIFAAIVFCGKCVHTILLRIVVLPLPPISSSIVSFIHKAPIVVGACLISVALATCGSVSLMLGAFVYFILLTKMYEKYFERFVWKKAKMIARKVFKADQTTTKQRVEEQKCDDAKDMTFNDADNENRLHNDRKQLRETGGLARIHFHMPLFILLLILLLLNIPCFLSWAKNYRELFPLRPDASLIPSLVTLGSLSVLWQIKVPKNTSHHHLMSPVLYTAALFCILYCQTSVYRLNFTIPCIFVFVMLYQLVEY